MIEPNGALEYDAESVTGLRWTIDASTKARKGSPAGSDAQGRYWRIRYRGADDQVHRVIWRMHHGPIPKGLQVDHIDGNGKNNRIENLRLVSCAVNQRNKGVCERNRTGITGVRYSVRSDCYEAVWHDGGRQKTKTFSCRKYGAAAAKQLAADFRSAAIRSLNEKGSGYSPTHGLRRIYG